MAEPKAKKVVAPAPKAKKPKNWRHPTTRVLEETEDEVQELCDNCANVAVVAEEDPGSSRAKWCVRHVPAHVRARVL